MDHAILAEQKQLLRLALRSVVLDDCVHRKEADRSLVLPGHEESLGIQRRPRQNAAFCAIVHDLVDEQHPHVRTYLRAAQAGLTPTERAILRLRVGLGHTSGPIREALGLGSRVSVDAEVDRLLGVLAEQLWVRHTWEARIPDAGPGTEKSPRRTGGRER